MKQPKVRAISENAATSRLAQEAEVQWKKRDRPFPHSLREKKNRKSEVVTSCCKSRDECARGGRLALSLYLGARRLGLQNLDSLRKQRESRRSGSRNPQKETAAGAAGACVCVCSTHAYMQHVFSHRFPELLCDYVFLCFGAMCSTVQVLGACPG